MIHPTLLMINWCLGRQNFSIFALLGISGGTGLVCTRNSGFIEYHIPASPYHGGMIIEQRQEKRKEKVLFNLINIFIWWKLNFGYQYLPISPHSRYCTLICKFETLVIKINISYSPSLYSVENVYIPQWSAVVCGYEQKQNIRVRISIFFYTENWTRKIALLSIS